MDQEMSIFPSQGTSTTATVDEYGLYEFIYEGCNETTSVFVDFSPSPPSIIEQVHNFL